MAISVVRAGRRKADDPHSGGPWLAWALCADARSGSSWLSQLAGSTDLLGYPDEYLLQWERWCTRLGLSAATSLDEYVSCLIRHRASPNGVFGIKGSYSQLEPFFRLFPGAPCVWLTRENKLEQAVSWHRANDGGLWHRTDKSAAPRPFAVSVERVLGFYDEILRREALWRRFFAERGVPPLELTYETVCREPLAAVRAIAAHVGVDPGGIEQATSPLRITRDDETAHWVRLAEEALRARRVSFNRDPQGSASPGTPSPSAPG